MQKKVRNFQDNLNLKNKSNQKKEGTTPLNDVHRKISRIEGGEYVEDNTVIIQPKEHAKLHGCWRDRDTISDELKAIFDDRQHIIKLKNKVNNQLLAAKRDMDTLLPETKEMLEEQLKVYEKMLAKRTSNLKKKVKEFAKVDKLTEVTLKVPSIGEVTAAALHVFVDLTKARHASCLWSYVGLHKASHERYTKGETSGGNKTLRTVLYTTADSQIKGRGSYREVYDNTKARLEKSENITTTRLPGGKLVKKPWKEVSKGHRDGAAKRQIMKHFLADYWYVGRTLLGLPTSALYPEAILGGNHRTIMPEERGWEY